MADDKFTVRVEWAYPRHTRVSVFNRGGLAGQLTILTEDVDEFVRRVVGSLSIGDVDVSLSGWKVVGVELEKVS